uniref:Uncharacterized protein n=1 Tax=Pyricularia oryzae (strain P131) TaxID=1143193 RepID=L7J6Y4_PYRO1
MYLSENKIHVINPILIRLTKVFVYIFFKPRL